MHPEKPVSFLHALFGLAVNPFGTSQRLISVRSPRYLFSLLLCSLLVIVLPVALQVYFLQLPNFRTEVLQGLFIVLFFTFIPFIVSEYILLKTFGVAISFNQVKAMIIYSLTPLTFATLAVLLFNHHKDGSITLVTKALTGFSYISPEVFEIILVAYIYYHVAAMLIILGCVKQIGRTHWISALFYSILSLVPFYLCLVGSLALAEAAIPGTMQALFRIVPWFGDLVKQI